MSIGCFLKGEWRRERDSNPRSGDRKAVFKTAAFNHSAIPPAELLFYSSEDIPASTPLELRAAGDISYFLGDASGDPGADICQFSSAFHSNR